MEILNETEGSPPAETVTQEQNRLDVARKTDAQGLLRQSQVFKWRAMKTIFFSTNFEFLGVPWRENGVGYEVGYRRLGKRLAAAERAGMRWQAVEAIRLIALTGCRREEVQRLRRTEVHKPGQALRLGDTKKGYISRRRQKA